MQIDNEIQQRISEWLEGPYDEHSKTLVTALKEDPKALSDAFYSHLEFGTGGLRGLMGVGTNRLNIYTIRKATQALANYIFKQGDPTLGVFIGFDSRYNSLQFAKETARVLAGNGIRAYLLNALRPTPFISFACRKKGCQAAVMITASHNPKEYNGYKVYWKDGGQIVYPHDAGIMLESSLIQTSEEIKVAEENHPLIVTIGDELDECYLQAIYPLQSCLKNNKELGSTLKITYTSLHGTGITLMPKALNSWGFSSISYVEEQITPDGGFPTVSIPNPEYLETLKLGIERTLELGTDLLIATDPDADRMAAAVNHHNSIKVLSGNEIATLCVYYLCEHLSKQPGPQPNAFITTVVSTSLISIIAKFYKNECFEVLTGFKYIGEMIALWEQKQNSYRFIFGAEESYGYLLGTHARDKDAIVSGCLIAEIALSMKQQGKTLFDLLETIYRTFGLHREKQLSIEFAPGQEGLTKIKNLMHKIRTCPPLSLCEQSIIDIIDYKTGNTLPSTDMLRLSLENGSRIIIRPSGTEPKLKIYGAVIEPQFTSLEHGIQQCETRLTALLEAVQKELL
jgi:phosphomannomutase